MRILGKLGCRLWPRTICFAGAGLILATQLAGAQAVSNAPAPHLKIGIIGSGRMGGSLGELWAKAGHEILFSSRHPEELTELVERVGPRSRAGTPAEAVAFGEVIFVAVPYAALPQIGRDLAGALSGKIVLDASNPVPTRDGPPSSCPACGSSGRSTPSTTRLSSAKRIEPENAPGFPSPATTRRLWRSLLGWFGMRDSIQWRWEGWLAPKTSTGAVRSTSRC